MSIMSKLVGSVGCVFAAAVASAGTLPDGYTEVACITVTDQNQYINTGFTPYYMTDIEAHFSVPDFSSQNVLYWTRTSSSFAFITKANTSDPTKTNKVRAYRSSDGSSTVETTLPEYLTSTNILYSTKMVDNRTDNTFTVNGQKVNFVAATGTGRMPSMFLFRLNDNGSLYSGVKAVVGMKLYSFTITEGGAAVADFVPCVRDADGVAGLYDTVRNAFYPNSGTGGSFGYEELAGITICPIPTQVNETFEPCRPELVVSNRTSGATWIVGGDIASPIVDVAYANNYGAGEATVTVTGKGEYAGQRASGSFTITATKLEDDNLVTADTLARRYEANGKYIYEFKSTASAQTATAKRGLVLSDYLLVGGGGGGGNNRGGGGGAGGVTNATGLVGCYIGPNDTFAFTVGAGGAGSAATNAKGGNGGATMFTIGDINLNIPGGGGGGSWNNTAGVAGASGGGGAQNAAGGAGVAGFGFAGADGAAFNSSATGGGGGAGHAGYQANTSTKVTGNGGEGIASSITGEEVYYGGGGGGGGGSNDSYMPGQGGAGGGGNGYMTAAGANGVDGLGGGGGGGGTNSKGGNGGSGVVIFAVVPADFEIDPIPDQKLASGGCEPVPVVHSADGTTLLVKDMDYTVSYTDNDKPGTALMTIIGINGYVGKSTTISFTVCCFVDSQAATEGDGSVESPFATISNAVENAKTAIASGAKSIKIMVANGTYKETNLVLDAPIVIVGEERDGVEIVDNVAGKRAFTLSHEGAEVRNLTISGGGLMTNGGEGGHIRMTAGLVEGCVIKNGRASAHKGNGNGGNVWMSGGRIERCLVTGGTANWGGWNNNKQSCGMGLYASGGVIDNCFFKDNRSDNNDGNNSASVYISGTATMVNCTVTGGWNRNYYGTGSGIHIANAAAKVVNCVAYGNYIGKGTISSTAAANFGSANLGRYFYCAAAFTNASCATWRVLTDQDFVNYKSFTGNAEADLFAYFNSEEYATFDWHQRLDTPIVDRGTVDAAYRPADCAPLDFDGNERVSGASIDLGCWEYDQSQFACAGSLNRYGAHENEDFTFHAVVVGPASDTIIRWDYGNGVTEETRETTHVYAYPASGYFTVRVSASPDGGTTWTDWYTVPARVAVAPTQMFVDSNSATPLFPYNTRETAATTLGAAVGALTNNVSENKTIIGGVDIVILRGSQSNDTGCFLATAVTIRGESSNPADAEIVDNVAGFRAFTLTHPDAVVSNLTISGGGFRTTGAFGGEGGHVRMTAGLVANCVIKNGRAASSKGYGFGGNVWMSGGRLERCLVAGGTANWGGFSGAEACGMGLYATGGTIDSCWFKDNKTDNSDGHNSASVYLNGAVTMVNCTVTGGWARNYNGKGSGIHINNAAAKVVNCVTYGNYIGKGTISSTAAANIGSANLDRYFYCGAAFTNASCATWTMLTDSDFVKYSSFTGTAEADLKTYFNSEEYATFDWHQKRDSQLIGRGTLDTAYRPADSVTRDLDGNERVLNRTIDLGCWEKMLSVGFFYILR